MRKILLVLLLFALLISPLYAGGNRWTSKPQIGSTIDWENPLSKGLTFCLLFNENGGRQVVDLVNGRKGTWTTTNITWKPTPKGWGIKGSGTYYTGITLANSAKSWQNGGLWTVFVYVKPATGSTADYPFMTKHVNSGNYIGVGWDNQSGVRKLMYLDNATGKVNSASTINMNIFNQYVYRLTSTTSLDFLINGNLDATSTITAKSFVNTNIEMTNANYGGFNGEFVCIYIWQRSLSNSEIQQLYQDPYCFIKPPTIWSMFSTAVAAARRSWMFD